MNTPIAGLSGRSRLLLCNAAVLALMVPLAAQAQEEVEDPTGNMIIVTATKREQTLQETPVAVSVTTAETLQREQIRDLKDLQSVVPSLRVSQLQSSANTNFIIRGFGNGANNAGIEPSVGVFIDGVYRSRTAAQISDLPNVSRIEVLRGPQSTLFGKNASAGVISLVTSAPSFTPEGSLEVSYGNLDAVVARAYVSAPLSESVAVSLAGGVNQRDGYNIDTASNSRTNERDRWFIRGQALFDNGDNFRMRLIADYDRIDEFCCGVVNVRRSPASAAILALGGQINDPNDPFANRVFNNFPSRNDITNFGVSAQLDFDLFGDFTLTSISAARKTEGAYDQDVDFTSLDLLQRFQVQNLSTYTQELRVAGSVGPVSLLAGLFYFDERITEDQTVNKGTRFRAFADLSAGGNGSGAVVTNLEGTIGTLYGDPTQYIGTFFTPGVAESGRFLLTNDALSLFGQIDFEITDGLVLTLGGNYTMDRKRAVTNYQSVDVFSNIDLVDAGFRAIRAQGIATTVGTQLGLAVRQPRPRLPLSLPAPARLVPQARLPSRPLLPGPRPLPRPTRTTRRSIRSLPHGRCSCSRASSTFQMALKMAARATTISPTLCGWPMTLIPNSTSMSAMPPASRQARSTWGVTAVRRPAFCRRSARPIPRSTTSLRAAVLPGRKNPR